jgi:ABC-2 type transport system permease protein
MRTILYIIQKEFLQIFRNKSMLPIIFVIPIVQLIILVNAANLEMKKINIYLVDNDLSSTSRKLTNKFESSPFYEIKKTSFDYNDGVSDLIKDKVDIILRIPHNFERTLVRENKASLQLTINAINGTSAGLINAYSLNIISDFNKSIVTEWFGITEKGNTPLQQAIQIKSQYWYNPQLNYKNYMVPAVLVILVTIIGMFLSSMNLVREKEIGTIEQINVTPIKKYQFITGKLIPFWIIALFELSFGLIIGKLVFNIPTVGSIGLVFLFASVYLLVILGLGLFLSTITQTQQQAMFLAFFTIMVFMMMSGIFTPTETMPAWAQKVNVINPVMYFMRVIRMILLKGSGFADVMKEFITISIYAYIILSLAVWKYKKVS